MEEKYKPLDFILDIKPSPPDERDFLTAAIYTSPVVLPETLDYRHELPPIRNQGNQGSCSAQTASCMKEWQERKDVGFEGHMSPQFVYNLRPNVGTSGMYPRDTMKILQQEGIVPETEYPYGSDKPITQKLKKKAKNYTIQGYSRIHTINDLKKALVANGPCYMAFPVKNWTPEFWRDLGKNVNYGGHAVTCVGYTKDAFIIRNSWGTGWGYEGYTYYPFSEWGSHWEAWTTIDADSNPAPIVSAEEEVPKESLKKKEVLEEKLRKRAQERLSIWQKIFFWLNKKS